MTNKAINQYLSRYAEKESRAWDQGVAKSLSNLSFQHCAVIPCYDESLKFIERLNRTPFDVNNILFIVVVNQPESREKNERNIQILDHFKSEDYHSINNIENMSLYERRPAKSKNERQYWLTINRTTNGLKIPDKQGVGLARKIGTDVALALFNIGLLSTPWIRSTDADTHLPANYFSTNMFLPTQASAATFVFEHICDKTPVGQATQRYEQSLHAYVDGLRRAGSPYAHHTIGSILAINLCAYAQVRGFPKRAGGEDFYLLNKLAKVGRIINIPDIKVFIDARTSERVPFGTGPAVRKILELKHIDQFTHYSPEVYNELKNWLDHIPLLAEQENCVLDELSLPLKKCLEDIQVAEFFQHAKKQAKNRENFIRMAHDWFDSFKTLKLIHALRYYFPDKPLKTTDNN